MAVALGSAAGNFAAAINTGTSAGNLAGGSQGGACCQVYRLYSDASSFRMAFFGSDPLFFESIQNVIVNREIRGKILTLSHANLSTLAAYDVVIVAADQSRELHGRDLDAGDDVNDPIEDVDRSQSPVALFLCHGLIARNLWRQPAR